MTELADIGLEGTSDGAPGLVLNPKTGKYVKPSSLARSRHRAEASQIRKEQKEDFQRKQDRLESQQATKIAKEEASAKADRIKQERRHLLLTELTPPLAVDELLTDDDGNDIPNTSLWKSVLKELDIHLTPLEREMEFENLYHYLNFDTVGRLILNYFQVPLLPELPKPWHYHSIHVEGSRHGELHVVRLPSYFPQFGIWENKTAEELESYYAKHKDYYDAINRHDGSVQQSPHISDEDRSFFESKTRILLEETRKRNEELKRKYREHLRQLEKTYLQARQKMTETIVGMN